MSGMISNFWMLAEKETIPFYETGFFKFVMLLVIVGLVWFVVVKCAQSMRLSEYGNRLSIITISMVCSVLIIISLWAPKFGVDLSGGVYIIGQLNPQTNIPEGGERITAQQIIPTLKQRVDPTGTQDVVLRALGDEKIEVIIPSVSQAEATEIWERLARTGHLQFRIAADTQFHPGVTGIASELARKGEKARTIRNDEGKITARWYNLARELPDGEVEENEVLPIKYVPEVTQLIRDKRTGQLIDINAYRVNGRPPTGKRFAEQLEKQGISTPQILMMEPPSEKTDVQGKHLSAVMARRDETGKPAVNFDLNSEGAKRMQRLTSIHSRVGEKAYLLGIVLDDHVHSAPAIQSTIQSSGRITGNFTKKEIDDLIINLKSGKIDVALNNNPISQQFISSSLGEELKQKGLWAIGASFVLVLVFMVLYYRFSGIVAAIALIMNLALILAMIMAIRQPLTLTGLAGLVLTVGMSVDANVLIFERIREELGKGAALRMAIRNGFDKATVTIVDANVTTLITALVLYVIGTEQIKGFAVTLILGILMSMFTAIYCSRAVFEIAERKRWINKLSMTQILGKQSIDFLGKRGITFVLSTVLIIAGIVGMFSLGSRILDHDLRGGSTAQVVFNESMDSEDIAKTLNDLPLTTYLGEEVTFTVTQVGDETDNMFKVDSNLPSYDGTPNGKGETLEPWKELDQILSETFAGKLKLQNVEVGPITIEDGSTIGNESSSYRPGLFNFTLPSLVQTARFGPTVMLQDDGNQEGENSANQDESTANQQGGESNQDNSENNQDDSAVNPENQNTDNQTDETEQDGATDLDGRIAKFNLTFDYPTSGTGIKRFLIESAKTALDRQIDEEQIKVMPEEIDQQGTPDSTRATNWTVELQVDSKEDAEKILNNWSSDFNQQPYFPVSGGVGGQIAKETQFQALAAILASLLGIIAYVWIRFQNIAFGLAAVIALIHDVLIVLGAIALSHYVAGALGFLLVVNFKISLPVVAALLTIIGYSLNDTIVVFDRIREVRGKRSEINEEMINSSISQTLSRTILTSLTTFIVVFILYLFGGEAIHGFAFALTVGVIVGTYSSIFVASPALLWLMNRGLSPDYDEHGNPIKAV